MAPTTTCRESQYRTPGKPRCIGPVSRDDSVTCEAPDPPDRGTAFPGLFRSDLLRGAAKSASSKGESNMDLIIKTRLEALKNNLIKIQGILESVKDSRAEIDE